MSQTVECPKRKLKEMVCIESPVTKYRNATASLSPAEIGFLSLVDCLVIEGPTRLSKLSNVAGDMKISVETGLINQSHFLYQ